MKLLYTFLRDMKVSYRTYYVYIEFIMALLFVAVLLFVVPENMVSSAKMYLYLQPGVDSQMILDSLEADGGTKVTVLDSREDVVLEMEKDRASQGAVISMDGGILGYEVILQGYESDKIRNIISKALEGAVLMEHPFFVDKTEVLVLDESAERLSDRLNFLPVYLLLNSGFMGLFIVAAYVFMDKEEGTIKALTVTPVSIRDYLLSKVGVMLFTGILTGLLTTILVAGLHVNYLYLILLLVSTNIFGTALGLLVASFYDTLMKSMGMLYLVIMVLAFASTSYFMPSFSPLAIRLLPSYPMLFAFRETFLAKPDVGFIMWNVLGFLALGAVIFMLAVRRYKKTLTV